MPPMFNHQCTDMENLLNPKLRKKLGLVAKTNRFSSIQGFVQYWIKNVPFHFTFPSKNVKVTNYSHICH